MEWPRGMAGTGWTLGTAQCAQSFLGLASAKWVVWFSRSPAENMKVKDKTFPSLPWAPPAFQTDVPRPHPLCVLGKGRSKRHQDFTTPWQLCLVVSGILELSI